MKEIVWIAPNGEGLFIVPVNQLDTKMIFTFEGVNFETNLGRILVNAGCTYLGEL